MQEEQTKTKLEFQMPSESVWLWEITRPRFVCHSAADVGRQHDFSLSWQNSHLSSGMAPPSLLLSHLGQKDSRTNGTAPSSTVSDEQRVSKVDRGGKSMRCSSPQSVICYSLICSTEGSKDRLQWVYSPEDGLSSNSFYQQVTGSGGSRTFLPSVIVRGSPDAAGTALV